MAVLLTTIPVGLYRNSKRSPANVASTSTRAKTSSEKKAMQGCCSLVCKAQKQDVHAKILLTSLQAHYVHVGIVTETTAITPIHNTVPYWMWFSLSTGL